MPRGLNKATLIGNLGADPEFKETEKTKLVTFSIATTDEYKDRNGVKQTDTQWHNCVAFGNLAEICVKFLNKGSKIHVEGKIENRSYEDPESGQKKYRSQIKIHDMIMLGGDYSSSESRSEDTRSEKPERKDDLPF